MRQGSPYCNEPDYSGLQEQLPEQDCHKISLLALGFSS